MQRKYLMGMGVGAALALAGVSLSACGADSKKDAVFSCDDAKADNKGAPIKNCSDPTQLHVFRMPDGFRNVVFGCNGHVGMYVTSRGWVQNGTGDLPSLPSGITAVANDPNCP